MIQGTYYKEWSSVLNREMEFKVYGSAGVPVLALPAFLSENSLQPSHNIVRNGDICLSSQRGCL